MGKKVRFTSTNPSVCPGSLASALAGPAKLMTMKKYSDRCVNDNSVISMMKIELLQNIFSTKKLYKKLGLGWGALALISGCVSIKLGSSRYEKSKDVEYSEPKNPFEDFNSAYLDQAWKNKRNGNTISFLSECNNPTDPTLESILRGIVAQLENAVVLDKTETEFNARSAINSTLEGTVDGVSNRMQVVIFKKNNCTFILTYTGLTQSFGDNQRDFYKFAKGFHVP